jgi:hypothetical protein
MNYAKHIGILACVSATFLPSTDANAQAVVTKEIVVSHWEFQPQSSTDPRSCYEYTCDTSTTATGGYSYVAPLPSAIPDGSTVESVECYYVDKSTTGELKFSLRGHLWGSSGYIEDWATVASGMTAVSPGSLMAKKTLIPSSQLIVDRTSRSYTLMIQALKPSTEAASKLRWASCKITYDVTE